MFIPTPLVFVGVPFVNIGPFEAFNGNDRTFCYDCGTSKADIQTTFTLFTTDYSGLASAGYVAECSGHQLTYGAAHLHVPEFRTR